MILPASLVDSLLAGAIHRHDGLRGLLYARSCAPMNLQRCERCPLLNLKPGIDGTYPLLKPARPCPQVH